MDDTQKSSARDAYWAIRVLPSDEADGFVGEVYNELAMTFEMTDPSLAPIEGAWLHRHVYRTLTVYAAADAAREAAERMRSFLDFAHLRD